MGLTYSIMMPLGQRNQRTYQYIPRPKKHKKYNKHKKSRISDTELINPVESTSTKIDEEREKEIVAVFERHVEKAK
jgi:hypothetical protein